MKILFVNERCGYFGGVEQNVADTAEGLRARGHECFLAYGEVTWRGASEYKALFDATFSCIEMASGSGNGHSHALREIAKQVEPDVIYFHKIPELAFGDLLLSEYRTVRMVHDHDLCCPRRHKYFALSGRVCQHPAGWRCWADAAFLTRDRTSRVGVGWVSIGRKVRAMQANYRIDRLLVGSRFMRDELLLNGFGERSVQVLPPVVRTVPAPPTPVPQEPRILYVGQLIRGKGVDLLLRALPHLSCEFFATIVGMGNAERKLRAVCHGLGLTPRVHFQGWVDHQELDAYYREAKVVVVPSRWPEPFGMVGLEAMHRARPVVGFGVGGIPDWLEHEVTGLLVPEQDVQGLARALERVLTDTELADTLGKNGHERVLSKYSFERYLDQLESHLQLDSRTTAAYSNAR